MTEETTTPASEEQNINISIEQICAAILQEKGSIEVSIENLIMNYGGKTIAINQDDETKSVTFTLVDAPVENVEEDTDTAE